MRPVSICCVQITGTACLEATYTDDSKSGHWSRIPGQWSKYWGRAKSNKNII